MPRTSQREGEPASCPVARISIASADLGVARHLPKLVRHGLPPIRSFAFCDSSMVAGHRVVGEMSSRGSRLSAAFGKATGSLISLNAST